MDEFVIQMFAQFPTVAGLLYLAVTLRAELKSARDENRETQAFIQKVLLLLMNQPGSEEQSRASIALRSKVKDP